MNHIKQHIPGWADVEPEDGSFNTTEELLAIPFVAKWNNGTLQRFSMSRNLLMAELTNGSFWVVGRIKDPSSVELPQWREVKP